MKVSSTNLNFTTYNRDYKKDLKPKGLKMHLKYYLAIPIDTEVGQVKEGTADLTLALELEIRSLSEAT